MTGRFAAAVNLLAKRSAGASVLDADPLLARIDGCLDCDLGTAQQSEPWTLGRLATELRTFELQALRGGDDAARAALAVGTALFNLTRHGNNRAAYVKPTNARGTRTPPYAGINVPYHREVLAQCGSYRRWFAQNAGASERP